MLNKIACIRQINHIKLHSMLKRLSTLAEVKQITENCYLHSKVIDIIITSDKNFKYKILEANGKIDSLKTHRSANTK